MKKIAKLARDIRLYHSLAAEDRRAGKDLTLVQDNLAGLGPRDIVLVVCLRNERMRLPAFAEHYRRIGVRHFMLIDNDSEDDLMSWASAQSDVSVWHTSASYRGSNFGMLWCNALLRRYGVGRWCVVVDPDEFLVYPYMETRDLAALTRFLDDDGRPCMHTVMLDAYSDLPLGETVLHEGENPFELCPYFDGDGYLQRQGWGHGNWIRGGPRLRVHFRDAPQNAPSLNKISLIKWQKHFHYHSSMHDAHPWFLNRAHREGEVSTTGCLFHFKFVA
ncbi:MAG: glycosyltransferase family 2 protein, partial [Pseudomonadota bacterium]